MNSAVIIIIRENDEPVVFGPYDSLSAATYAMNGGDDQVEAMVQDNCLECFACELLSPQVPPIWKANNS